MKARGAKKVPTATMTTKGQITMPKEIRDLLHLESGDRVLFVPLGGNRVEIVRRNRSVEDLFGMVYDPSIPPMTIEEMNDAIAEGGAASGMRGLER